MATVAKRKRVSKRNKISWRKNIDLEDVDNFMEERRLEERLGKSASQKLDSELYEIDTKGGPSKRVHIPHVVRGTIGKSLRAIETETPKCFAILERRSAVPDPLLGRNKRKARNVPKGPQPIKKKEDTLKSKEETTLRDIWSEQKVETLPTEWLTNDTVRHTLSNTRAGRKRNPKRIQPSAVPAIETPHPGLSYNPSYSDHKALLDEVIVEEMNLEQKEKHIKRVTTDMFKKLPVAVVEKNWLQEMSVCLDPKVDSESEPENTGYSTVNEPAERKKKNLKERRKIKENRRRVIETREAQVEKKKRSDLHNRIQQFNREISKDLEKSLEVQEKRKKRNEAKQFETKILGKTRFEVPLKEFQAPEDLKGSLRKLAPVGNALFDRFTSLKKRNIVEPTLKRPKRKVKTKRFIKPSHRMDFDPKGY